MLRIIGGRQTGKTASLIAYAVRTGSNILVANSRMAVAVFNTADLMGLIGPEDWKNRKNGRYTIGEVEILSFSQVFVPRRGLDYRKNMVADELEMILESENVVGYSFSYDDNLPEEVHRMPRPVTYMLPVRHGKWTLNEDGSITCSECKRKQLSCVDNWDMDNFCHFCGADMRGDRSV